jgi:hypothetical protein
MDSKLMQEFYEKTHKRGEKKSQVIAELISRWLMKQ